MSDDDKFCRCLGGKPCCTVLLKSGRRHWMHKSIGRRRDSAGHLVCGNNPTHSTVRWAESVDEQRCKGCATFDGASAGPEELWDTYPSLGHLYTPGAWAGKGAGKGASAPMASAPLAGPADSTVPQTGSRRPFLAGAQTPWGSLTGYANTSSSSSSDEKGGIPFGKGGGKGGIPFVPQGGVPDFTKEQVIGMVLELARQMGALMHRVSERENK